MTVFVRAVLLAAAAIGPVCVGTCQLYWHHPSHWLSIVSTACIIHHISWLFGYSDALTAHVARTKRPEEAKPPEWMSNNNCNNNQQETEVSESKANTYTSLSRAQKKRREIDDQSILLFVTPHVPKRRHKPLSTCSSFHLHRCLLSLKISSTTSVNFK